MKTNILINDNVWGPPQLPITCITLLLLKVLYLQVYQIINSYTQVIFYV